MSISSLNSRLRRLFEKYGMDFGMYQDITVIMTRNFETRVSKSGAIQIVNRKNQKLNPFQQRALADMEKMGGVRELEKSARQYLVEHGEKPTPERIKEIIEKRDYVKQHRDIISYISDQVKSGSPLSDSMRDLYNRAAGRTEELTYDELYDLMRDAMADYDEYYG